MAAALEDEEEQGHTVGQLLDFRTAFDGSVFEKYHVLPLQLATLDAGEVVKRPPFIKIGQFLLQPGNLDLLKGHREVFMNEFVKFCNSQGTAVNMSDCRDAVDVAADYMSVFGLLEEGEGSGDTSKDLRRRMMGCDADPYSALQGGIVLAVCMVEFALSDSMRLLGRTFSRSGIDVTHECDETLARKLFDFCRAGALYKDFMAINTLVQLIDFDLVGIDGQCFSLRMMLTIRPYLCDGWSVDVRDRQMGTLIATGAGEELFDAIFDGLPDHDEICNEVFREIDGGRTVLIIRNGNVVKERYKPHGDVPTVLTRVTTSADSSSSRFYKLGDGWVLDEDEAVRLYFEDCCSRAIISTSNVGEEEMKSLYHLRQASFVKEKGDSISYCGKSEFERLLPVAASLAYLYDGCVSRRVYSSFDSVVQHFRLRTSSQQESQQRDFQQIQKNCKRFHRIFKGTCWESLPEDLIVRIMEMVVQPPRHIVLPPKSA
ncbi:hypothetical protein CBR_g1183 [Chara braunii]|uniref:Uncharacterized protein n=1 Tax=Chara braunii TaxID=69332 RepID=A0A388KDC4_CHABU|nr:hypothetical protein CBR_g1183 [Chara braunii]|eukprot:GBG68062.1 hypothetical protein CBR_g1183 [Chara braunii]